MALSHNIPMIFYGENEAEYGNATSTSHKPQVQNSLFSIKEQSNTEMFFGGVSVSDLINQFGLTNNDFKPYTPPNAEEIKKKKLSFII